MVPKNRMDYVKLILSFQKIIIQKLYYIIILPLDPVVYTVNFYQFLLDQVVNYLL